MSIHYNPTTRPQFPQTLIYDEGVERPEDLHYHFHSVVDYKFTFSNRTEVLARNATGPAWWFEDGELHKGRTVGSWDFAPVTEESQPVFAGGINWGNAYFVTVEDAQEWLIKQSICDYDIRYEELGDVWCVHYHY